jgi:hypothetical protein
MNKIMLGVGVFAALLAGVPAEAARRHQWERTWSVYGWVPSIEASNEYADGQNGVNINVNPGEFLDAYDFSFGASMALRKGRWGGGLDFFYADLSNKKDNIAEFEINDAGGPIGIPAIVTLGGELSTTTSITTLYGSYRMREDRRMPIDLFAGVRYLDSENRLDWRLTGDLSGIGGLPTSGRAEYQGDSVDFIAGMRGQVAITKGNRKNKFWYIPYYADAGMGDADSVFQAATGVGYNFSTGQVDLTYRYLDYEFSDDSASKNLNFQGPMIRGTFRF